MKTAEQLETIREMFEEWHFFRAVLRNAEREMVRARLSIAARYNTLSPYDFHDTIVADYEKARAAILRITGQDELLDYSPVIKRSIELRNPYTDVLNLVQIELIRRWRRGDASSQARMQHMVFLSINGIAAAMQSTG